MARYSHDGITIYYEWHPGSNGRTITFLNGVMASTNSWEFYSDFFNKAGFNVLLHDFRGQLQSDKPTGPYSFEEHAADLAALMASLDIRQADIVGTSYGGEVAMKFATDYPDKTASLTVIDSVSETDGLLDAFIESWSLMARKETAREFYWSAIPALYSSEFIAEHRDILSQRAELFSQLPEDYFSGQRALYDTFKAIDLTGELKHITSPALVVCGTADILKPPKFSRIIADNIDQSRLVLLPDCGHVAIFEQPETLRDLISGFLSNS